MRRFNRVSMYYKGQGKIGYSSDRYRRFQHKRFQFRNKKQTGSQKGKGHCKKDEDCDSNSICLANTICVKGTRRNLDSLETNTNQLKFRRCNKDQQCPHVSAHDDSYADKIFIE